MDATGPYNKAALTYETGLEHNRQNEELMDGCYRATDGMNRNPQAARAALATLMQNPEVAAKVQKLVNASIVPP